MFNSAFAHLSACDGDYYPRSLREDIDAVNALVYPAINNGAYRCAFATTQAAYEKALTPLFSCLDELEQRLDQQRYQLGQELTAADWWLFTTLLRFDPVYMDHFKCYIALPITPIFWSTLVIFTSIKALQRR